MEQERKIIYRAGIIPYFIDGSDIIMLFMKPSNVEFGGEKFQIAKGKVDPEDKTHQDAALREGQEELGLFKGNILKIEEVGVFMGRTTIFTCKVKEKLLFGEPSYETSSTQWMTLEKFIEEGRELHVPVVKATYRKILSMEGITAENDF